MNNTAVVKQHYSSPELLARIEEGLHKMAKGWDTITLDDLAPVDEFHTRARAATIELIQMLGVTADMHVLDIGSGLGGPARHLAATSGCKVTGIDLSEDYCAVGEILNEWLGLMDKVSRNRSDPSHSKIGIFLEKLP